MSQELISIAKKFAESRWDVIDAPARNWLTAMNDKTATDALIAAVKQADVECGSCGCEMDPLYKRALELLKAA